MDPGRKDDIVRILLFIELLILITGGFAIVILEPDNALLVAGYAAASAATFVYSFTHVRLNRRMAQFLDDVLSALEAFNAEDAEEASFKKKRSYLLPVYLRIAEIRKIQKKRDEDRLRVINIVNSVAVNMEMEKILDELMPALVEVTNSNCGAFYLANLSTNKLEIKKSLGFHKNIFAEFDISVGESSVGIAAKTKRITIVNDIPDDTVYAIKSVLGKIKPKSIMIVPVVSQENLAGVFVFASIYNYSAAQLELVDMIKYYVGAAVGNGVTFEKTKRLTNELKFQNRLIQNLNDDLEKNVLDRTHFLNDIIDSVRDYAIYAMDKNGVIIVWNKGSEQLFGFSAEETIGKHVNAVYPEDEVKAGYVQRRLESVARDGRYVESGWRVSRDGSNYYAETLLFARYDSEDAVNGFTNVTKVITELKQKESALWFQKELTNKILDQSVSALILTDEEGFVQVANKAAVALLGTDLFEGQNLFGFFSEPEDVRVQLFAAVDDALNKAFDAALSVGGTVTLMPSFIENEVDFTRVFLIQVVPRQAENAEEEAMR